MGATIPGANGAPLPTFRFFIAGASSTTKAPRANWSFGRCRFPRALPMSGCKHEPECGEVPLSRSPTRRRNTMGQQQTATNLLVAAGSALRRTVLLLAVAAVMAAMMVVTVTPAFAAGQEAHNCIQEY